MCEVVALQRSILEVLNALHLKTGR